MNRNNPFLLLFQKLRNKHTVSNGVFKSSEYFLHESQFESHSFSLMSIKHVSMVLQALLHRLQAVSDVFEVWSEVRGFMPAFRNTLFNKVFTGQSAKIRTEWDVIHITAHSMDDFCKDKGSKLVSWSFHVTAEFLTFCRSLSIENRRLSTDAWRKTVLLFEFVKYCEIRLS